MKFLVERTCFMLLAIADTISAMELINKGIPPFCRIIYETGCFMEIIVIVNFQ